MPIQNLYLISIIFLIQHLSSQYSPQNITFIGCSSIYCIQCLNQYQCAVCMYNDQPICCPQFCTQCLDMNTCISCQPYFQLNLAGSSMICTRVIAFTDINCHNGTYLEQTTNSCFDCNFPNCANCTSYMNCSQCAAGYFLFNATQSDINPFNSSQTVIIQITPQCLLCMPNCINCTNASSCITCNSQYFYNGSACLACTGEYCLACNGTSQNCTQCIGGTYLNSARCILCSSVVTNCSNCNFTSNQFTCTDCAYGLYWNGTQCLMCLENCQLCSLYYTEILCYLCNDGYAINNLTNTCESCQTGCMECYFNPRTFTQTSCSVCDVGYVIDYNETTELFVCLPCEWPCIQCYNDSTACAKCQIGFYLNIEAEDNSGDLLTIGKCYFCRIENCLTCSSATECTKCEDGFYIQYSLETKSQICVPCKTNCILCENKKISQNGTSQVFCLRCMTGYTFLPNNNQTCVSCNNTNCLFCLAERQKFCVQCQPGYRLDYQPLGTVCVTCTLDNCLLCIQNTQTLTDGSTIKIDSCAACNVSYYSQDSNTQNFSYCVQCPQNCVNCENSTYCDNCSDGYYLSSTNLQECVACPVQCLTCDTYGRCLYCADSYYPLGLLSVSTNPPPNVTCLPCNVIEGCISCFNQEFCKECNSYMFAVLPGIGGDCLPCPNGCIQCNNEQECLICQEGYLLIDEPNSCLQQSGWPIWAIFSVSALGISLLFVLGQKMIRIFRMRKYKLKETEFSEILLPRE